MVIVLHDYSAKPRRQGTSHGGGKRRSSSGGSARRHQAGGARRSFNPRDPQEKKRAAKKKTATARFKRRKARQGNPPRTVLFVPLRRRRRRRRRRVYPVVTVRQRPLYPIAQVRWAKECPPPLSWDCQRLQVTASWAVGCFMPRFYELKAAYGPDFHGIVNDLLLQETPHCHLEPLTAAERELQRRVQLAVALLLTQDGYAVQLPPMPRTPRPLRADTIRQPWLRALLTGWI